MRDMPCSCVIRLSFPSPAKARAVAASLSADDDEYSKTTVEGTVLRAEITAPNAMSLRRAVNDYLACLRTAVDVVGDTQGEEGYGEG